MLRGYLVLDSDGRRVPVGQAIKVGRARECGLILDDASASRMHIEVKTRGDEFIWRDLGSSNGTVVNGSRMLAGELKAGDTIQVGETLLHFEVEEIGDSSELEETNLFNETILDISGKEKKRPGPTKSLGLLRAIYTVVNEISTNYEPCSLMDRILETTVRAIDAQRGAIFLKGSSPEELLPCPECGMVHRIRDGKLAPALPGEIRLSSTVSRRVLADGESVLYQDADDDAGLGTSESIVAMHLRSIVCVPLRAKHDIVGMLYIDSDREDQAYSQDDLLLASAVGNSAGLALENARMHRQMLDKQRIEQELATAWTIQESLLFNEWPENEPRFDVYAEMHPAKMVGGDFYDFVRIDAEHIGLLICDVSGKGMPAALTMARLLGDFRMHVRDDASPGRVLGLVSRRMYERSQQGMFCTICYLVLNIETGKLRIANAGHPPAFRVGAKGATPLPEPSGPPAGILPSAEYSDEVVMLDPGDMIVLFTDGLIEARKGDATESPDAPHVEFGVESLAKACAQHYRTAPKGLVKSVLADVQLYCAPRAPHDDCTMAALRFSGGPA